MDTSRRATGYDLFKLIVAILLLILFFLLMRRATPQSPALISTLATPALTASAVPTLLANAQPTTVPASSTSVSLTSTSAQIPTPTATNVATSTQMPLPSPTATNISAASATPLPSPTATSISSTFTPMADTPAATACEAASAHSRLQTGMNVTIVRRLNFRSSPGIGNNWLLTNIPGTRVEVVGGPECIPHSIGAYVWWQIKLPGGQIGWSAEASQYGSFYFMEPIP
jgi:hypothetical protein